jgi:hypothetical protein
MDFLTNDQLFSQDLFLRQAALDLAIRSWEGHKLYPAKGTEDVRTGQVVATARAYEAYLRGGALGLE